MKRFKRNLTTVFLFFLLPLITLNQASAIEIPIELYQEHIQQKVTQKLCDKAFEHCTANGYKKCQDPHNHCQLLHNTATIAAFLSFRFNQTVKQKEKDFKDTDLKESILAYCRYLIDAAPLGPKTETLFKDLIDTMGKRHVVISFELPKHGKIIVFEDDFQNHLFANDPSLKTFEDAIKKTFTRQWKVHAFDLKEIEGLNHLQTLPKITLE